MKKCSRKAYAMCQDRNVCGKIDDAVFEEGSECDTFNQDVDGIQKSNGDEVRSMSDEELAEFICTVTLCQFCVHHMEYGPCPGEYESRRCLDGITQWLKQPYQGK